MISKAHQNMPFYIAICIIGLCFGIYPGFTNERFESRYANVNYDIMFIGFAISGFLAFLLEQFMLKKSYT